jgi:hypothetical protein
MKSVDEEQEGDDRAGGDLSPPTPSSTPATTAAAVASATNTSPVPENTAE